MSKKFLSSLFTLVLLLGFTLLFNENVKAAEKSEDIPSKEELIELGAKPDKVEQLHQKIENGEKLESDEYLEEHENEILTSSENPYFRKDFSDGSFIESEIEDITEEGNVIKPVKPIGGIQTMAVDQIGGTQEYRTLKVSRTTPWGYFSFKAQIYFPLIGYARIISAYDWYYIGTVTSTEYKGVYRANETATQDAVAIYKLQASTLIGGSFLAKLELRIRDGVYWSTYSS